MVGDVPRLRHIKFLIVDDHAPMRRTLRELLAAEGDDVREAGDGAQAEVAYEEQHPDWVIMDVQMQPVGGLVATRHITARHPEAKIVIITQFDDPDLRASARAAGALVCLTKDNLFAVQRFVRSNPF